ncbi:succinate dehydrogenase assembly factor 4, mitochondrial isoform X2 [Sagmatias obliquidens]|uniref:succinate dehydrogenase assembly factor 4, mitochondrial isoform X2 n=1 Tax=Sagmatias obliquidens TaxID=3371155 RepID=UPI000F444428|nr:succinate dehydrogenase assembly factor 4, mitochondrial isoform X2 [Lagenorhynchus obliquidens]XP_026949001.1 succinate dehydrogenase assembly factor 4, mitochondrial isoform X2 [Lagenorhynchus obliquidens]
MIRPSRSTFSCIQPGAGARVSGAGYGGPARPAEAPPAPRPRPSRGACREDAAVADAAGVGVMVVLGFTSLLGRIPATAWRAARSPILCHSLRKISSQGEKSKPIKQPLKKPKLPEGRFDAPEDSNLEKEPLTKFPDDVNPVTKERGGPRGPEPTRYGDWERKGRCIDF